jgi:hypothetical protein
MMKQSAIRVLTMFLGATALSACAVDSGPTAEGTATASVASREQAIFGGEPAVDPKYAAVGALALRFEFEYEGETFIFFDSFCTGTLVADTAVLTARHCTEGAANYVADGYEVYFVFGPYSWEPEQAVPVTGWTQAPPSPTHPGLLLDGGRDVAVAYLAEAPVGITPAKVGVFKEKQAEDQFEIIGYGYTDYYVEEYGFYDVGTKMAGLATGRSLGGPWYSLLFDGDYDAYLEWYFTDAQTGAPSEEEALDWWNIYNLEPKYELLAGSPETAFGCFGDSGGPLGVYKKDKLTVYGVSFATESSISTICTGGGAYLVLNQEMHSWVKQAISHCDK